MPRSHTIHSSFLSGVLDHRASARIDTESYNQGLLRGINVEAHHLGGMRRRGGTRWRETLPNKLTRVASGSIDASAPNGGTANNAKDDDASTLLTTTTDVGTNDPFVVVHYDLGAATDIAFADVREIRSTGGTSDEFRIQYSTDDSNWTDFGDAFERVDTTVRSYRRGSTTPTSARYWRVAKVGGTTMGAVDTSTGDFSLWTESTTVPECLAYAFEVSTEVAYHVVLLDRTMRIYQSGVLVADLPSPYEDTDLAGVDAAQNQDSMVFVHEDYEPRFLIPELGTFYFDPIIFEEVPQYDFADSLSPTPTSEVQVITFGASFTAGDTVQIDLEGARSGAITYAGDGSAAEQNATAANLAREIQKLYTVPGFTGVSCARTNTREYTVTFAEASAKTYELMSGVTLNSKAGSGVGITITRTTPGVPRQEDAWSATRGYPRTVTFYEGRLYFGGTRSLPQTLFGSKVGRILNFLVEDALDDDGIFTTLENQQLNAIQGLYAGRALQFFTSGGEFRYVKPQGQPITPGDAPANQTQYGGAKIRPVSIDGATIFVQRTRKTIRDFRYDYEEDAYNSLGRSSLAPHLINNVQALGVWNGSNEDEISLVFVVNDDGTLAVLNSRQDAKISAWTQWITQGAFKSAVSVVEDVFFIVRRTINGTDRLFLEQRDTSLYTDCAVSGATVTTVNIEDVVLAQSVSWGTFTHTIETDVPHTLAVGDIIGISGVVASGHYRIPDENYPVVAVVDSTHIRIKVKGLSGVPSGSYVSGGSFGVGSSTAITGLDHLDGEECRVKGDGFVLESQTPASGAIEIEHASQAFEVGLNFNTDVTPMPINTMTPAGDNFMRRRKVSKAWVRVHETLGLLCNGIVIADRKWDASNFDEPVQPYSGVRDVGGVSTNFDATEDKIISFTQVDPLPMHILGIDVAVEWNE